jgi:hypothetical protein
MMRNDTAEERTLFGVPLVNQRRGFSRGGSSRQPRRLQAMEWTPVTTIMA